MALDSSGLSFLWDRIRLYVAGYVAENAYSANVATTDGLGVVKPDGITITVDQDGTLHGAAGSAAVSLRIDTETVMELTPFGELIPDGDGVAY